MLLFLATLPPLLWALVNHIDKFAVDRYMKNRDAGALVIFTGLAGFFLGFLVLLTGKVQSIPLHYIVPMIAGGVILVLSYVPYLYALDGDEASNVGPLFQLVTPCVYVLAFIFLGEKLATPQLIAGGMIFIGALILSFDFKKTKIRMRSLLLMVLSSFLIGLNVVVFKSFALQTTFWTMAFYDLVGAALGGVLVFTCVRVYREAFLSTIAEFRYKVVSVNMLAETTSVLARLINGFVSLFLPIAIVQFVNGLQPLFILTIGIMVTKFAPRYGKEVVDRHALVQKFSAIVLMVSGLALLSFFVY